MAPPPKPPTTTFIALLVVAMLVTGISNSIFSKYQDMQCVVNCDNPDPSTHKVFEQPVWQTATMFLGETLCTCTPSFSALLSRYNKGLAPARWLILSLLRNNPSIRRSDRVLVDALALQPVQGKGSTERQRGSTPSSGVAPIVAVGKRPLVAPRRVGVQL